MNDILFFGCITEIDESLNGGKISHLDAFPLYNIDFKKDSSHFDIADSTTPIYLNKLVVFNRKLNVATNKTEIINISDFNIYQHHQFLYIFKRVTDRCEIINPDYHPWLLNYFLENKLYFYSYSHEYKKLLEAIELVNSFETMSYNDALLNYKVHVNEKKYGRPGKDDSAGIYLESNRSYRQNDSYLDLFLPNYSQELAFDKYFASYNIILDELWEQIGGENKRRELELQCQKIYEDNIKRYKSEYNSVAHLNHIIKHRNLVEREFRMKVQEKYIKAIVL